MDMNIVCLDLEGVLVPEIWIAFAEASGIPELKRTTRDEPDYDKLMKWRIGILKEHGLGLKEIQDTIAKIDPIPGAKEFLDELRSITQVIIISDTFSQFAGPLMKKLGYPTIFCNSLEVAENGDLANWIVPGKKVAGMGGAMDLCTGCPEVIIVMLHTQKGNPKILKKCTLPLTAERCVSNIITEMGVMEVREDGIWVVELHPDYTKEDIQAATGCELHFDPNMKAMEEE